MGGSKSSRKLLLIHHNNCYELEIYSCIDVLLILKYLYKVLFCKGFKCRTKLRNSSNSSHSAILWFCGFQEKASEFLLPAEPSEVRYFQPFFSCDLCFPGTEANPCIPFINHNYEPVPKGCSPSAQCVSKWKIWSDANLFSLCYTGNKDKRLHLPPL